MVTVVIIASLLFPLKNRSLKTGNHGTAALSTLRCLAEHRQIRPQGERPIVARVLLFRFRKSTTGSYSAESYFCVVAPQLGACHAPFRTQSRWIGIDK
jgi:hypothetical protein